MAQEDGEDAVHRENTTLLMEIASMCRRSDREYPETLLLIGTVGCGKSSMVNTIIKAITGEYKPKAAVGAGVQHSKTLYLQRYASCGVAKNDFVKEFNQDCLRNCLQKLPIILDVAGLGNEGDTPALPEILELLIGGYIPTGTNIENLQRLQADNVPGVLKSVYNKVYQENRVSKIVFVQSCRESVPKNLISYLQEALRATDPTTMQIKYTGEVYVVITKYDLVKEDNIYAQEIRDNNDLITLEEFKALEKKVAESLNMLGALEFNRIRWVSYTDTVGFIDNPHIDNIALKFLKRMLQCGAPPPDVVQPVITLQMQAEWKVKKLIRDVGQFQFISCKFIFFSIIILIVAFIVFKLLMAPPTSGTK